MDQVQGRRTTIAGGINHLDIDQRQVRSVSAQAARSSVNAKPNSERLSGGLDLRLADLLSVRVIADGFHDTGLPKNILEDVKETAALRADAL